MSEVHVGGGIFSTAWLLSMVILWLHPASFPAWIFDLCNIIFWIGAIGLIVLGAIVLILVIVGALD